MKKKNNKIEFLTNNKQQNSDKNTTKILRAFFIHLNMSE